MSATKLRMEVSLDDEWASGFVNCRYEPWVIARELALLCHGTDDGSILDPNGNTIGKVEVIE